MRVLVNDDISINYELTGDPATQRVLVLTHGMGGTLHNWDDEVPELSKKYAVLTWDVRGHGESDKPDMPYDAAMFAPRLRRNVLFAQHNLATDGCFSEFNVVLCRNVLIYFSKPLKERVLGLF